MRSYTKLIMSAVFLTLVCALVLSPKFSASAKSDAPRKSSLSWNVEQSNSYVEKGGGGEILVNLRIRGERAEVKSPIRRAPVNLALVIDRSGSMADAGKLEYAKESARRIIEGLDGSDRLSIVAYSTDVEMLFPLQFLEDKRRALDAVDALYPTDSTNLAGGLVMGIDEIKSRARSNYISRVILLSDGLANAGITDRGEIRRIASRAAEGGAHVTAMGLGVDYDEDLMTDIAEYGAGNYYFIESPSQIAGIFEREFNGILATVARDAALTIDPAPGVRIVDVYGYTSVERDGKTRINLGDMAGGQERNILIRFAVPADKLGKRELLRASLEFRDAARGGKSEIISRDLAFEVTGDKAKAAKGENKEILAKGASAASAEEMHGATVEYQKGNRTSALTGIQNALDRVVRINNSPQKTEATARQEAELRDAMSEMSAPAAPAPESDAGKGLIKEYKAKAREQMK